MEAELIQQIFDLLFVAVHVFVVFKGWQAGSVR